jgi:hypothetical protein
MLKRKKPFAYSSSPSSEIGGWNFLSSLSLIGSQISTVDNIVAPPIVALFARSPSLFQGRLNEPWRIRRTPVPMRMLSSPHRFDQMHLPNMRVPDADPPDSADMVIQPAMRRQVGCDSVMMQISCFLVCAVDSDWTSLYANERYWTLSGRELNPRHADFQAPPPFEVNSGHERANGDNCFRFRDLVATLPIKFRSFPRAIQGQSGQGGTRNPSTW